MHACHYMYLYLYRFMEFQFCSSHSFLSAARAVFYFFFFWDACCHGGFALGGDRLDCFRRAVGIIWSFTCALHCNTTQEEHDGCRWM